MLNWKRAAEIAMCAALFAGCASMGSSMAPADIVKERQAGMKAIAKASGAMKSSLAASPADPAAIKAAAVTLSTSFDRIHTWWPESTKGEPMTKSKPEIWTNKAGFKVQVDGVRAASRKLGVAAKGNDVAAIKTAYEQVTPFCGSCHGAFRINPTPPAKK